MVVLTIRTVFMGRLLVVTAVGRSLSRIASGDRASDGTLGIREERRHSNQHECANPAGVHAQLDLNMPHQHTRPCIPGTTLGRALAQIDGDRRVDKPVSNWTLQNVSLIPLDSVPKYGV